jgi:putative phosphoesterase
MKQIGLLSDTHGYCDDTMLQVFSDCDEIWHAGDWGDNVSEKLEQSGKIIRGVYGNIDGRSIRTLYPEKLLFEVEGLSVFITHIGGYPGNYHRGIKEELLLHKVGLFICGHSHILKIMPDKTIPGLLHINPGAAGKSGFHVMRTMVKFKVDQGKLQQPEVVELGLRNKI